MVLKEAWVDRQLIFEDMASITSDKIKVMGCGKRGKWLRAFKDSLHCNCFKCLREMILVSMHMFSQYKVMKHSSGLELYIYVMWQWE